MIVGGNVGVCLSVCLFSCFYICVQMVTLINFCSLSFSLDQALPPDTDIENPGGLDLDAVIYKINRKKCNILAVGPFVIISMNYLIIFSTFKTLKMSLCAK